MMMDSPTAAEWRPDETAGLTTLVILMDQVDLFGDEDQGQDQDLSNLCTDASMGQLTGLGT